MSYEIVGHPSEAKFTASADSKEELFSEAVEAFSEVVGGQGGSTRHSFAVESESLEALLFDFLDAMIYLQDVEDVAVTGPESVSYEELEHGHRLEVTVWTEPAHRFKDLKDVKGPTYSEMEIDYDQDDGWNLVAVMDL